ncbi:hypothetical protein SAMN04487906_1933 [Zhouia amylolytica]|uniref:Esterase n=1 Tax=Zhouia amylolytica TaxID=376730 RepID=A0A1I6TAI6_9FLAO|nr:alpha/beta hydrolase-fold protein [Zhouia amylolytica]SFS85997.1 hypothetical protein SAMN04487906_1933 [Zhouia amylolytica]
MKNKILSFILLFTAALAFSQSIPKQLSEEEFSIGKTLEIESELLHESRTLNIYLPSSYKENQSKKYPVIYLLDGSKDEDFIHIAGIVQFGSFSWIEMVPESIVVGIGNVDRKRDFTYPSTLEIDRKEFPTSGKSAHFINFIKKELQPFIDANFRTENNKTLIGQSLGGLLATEILFKEPELFSNYIIISPSLWWDNERLLDYKPSEVKTGNSIYVAVGKEGDVMERTAKTLYEKIKAERGKNTKVYFEFLADKTHGDALHEAVYHAFEKIFE